jgi:hypothetical protein
MRFFQGLKCNTSCKVISLKCFYLSGLFNSYSIYQMMNFKFRKLYLFPAMFIFLLEALIALYVHDDFIRPYVGDFLVVILIYCFLKSFWDVSYIIVAVSTLLFSYIIEFSQYLKLINLPGIQDSKAANLILGSSFSWIDMIAYSMGIGLVFLIESLRLLSRYSNK